MAQPPWQCVGGGYGSFSGDWNFEGAAAQSCIGFGDGVLGYLFDHLFSWSPMAGVEALKTLKSGRDSAILQFLSYAKGHFKEHGKNTEGTRDGQRKRQRVVLDFCVLIYLGVLREFTSHSCYNNARRWFQLATRFSQMNRKGIKQREFLGRGVIRDFLMRKGTWHCWQSFENGSVRIPQMGPILLQFKNDQKTRFLVT